MPIERPAVTGYTTAAAHTPGPWEANKSEMEAHSSLVEIRGKGGAYVVTKDVGYQNARLIAAAPDLLEALQSLLEIGKRDLSNPKYDGYFQTAREVVAAATGI